MNHTSAIHTEYSKDLSLSRLLIYLIIISLAVAPAFALGGDNRNLLLIGVMALSPVIVLFSGLQLYKSDIWLILFMGSIIAFPLLHQPEAMRWSTVLYSCMFCLTFMAYNRLLHFDTFSVVDYQRLLKFLILAYFAVLVVQQFCVLTGLPVINLSNYDPETPWKLNALSAEPSHSGRIVGLLMYCYITVREMTMDRTYDLRQDIRKDRLVWIAFIWTMITMGSATAFVFFIIVLLKFMRIRNLIPVAGLMIVVVIFANWLGVESYERSWNVLQATLTFDIQEIIKTDHSASFRIVPFIVLSDMVNLTTLNGWFGYGIDHTSTILPYVIPASPDGLTGGGLFQLWIEYGFLSFMVFIIFSFTNTFNEKDYLSLGFWILLVFMYGVNSQIVWLCIIFLYSNDYFRKISKTDNILT